MAVELTPECLESLVEGGSCSSFCVWRREWAGKYMAASSLSSPSSSVGCRCQLGVRRKALHDAVKRRIEELKAPVTAFHDPTLVPTGGTTINAEPQGHSGVAPPGLNAWGLEGRGQRACYS